MSTLQQKIETIIGPLYLAASEKGLQSLFITPPEDFNATNIDPSSPQAKILQQTATELDEYFRGRRTSFDVPLDVVGTDFQKSVWTELCRIPFGQTRSYSEIATSIQKQKAVRAVGTANGRNPISIIVPCHRVIAADGTLGGYSGGLANKTKLLELEKNYALKK